MASPGRPKGSVNAATLNARAAIGRFVDRNTERLDTLLDQIEADQGPQAAWKCIMDLIEYHVPKLARTEHVGDGGGPVRIVATDLDEKL